MEKNVPWLHDHATAHKGMSDGEAYILDGVNMVNDHSIYLPLPGGVSDGSR